MPTEEQVLFIGDDFLFPFPVSIKKKDCPIYRQETSN